MLWDFLFAGESCFGVPSLNVNGPLPLNRVSDLNDISSTFARQLHDRLRLPHHTLDSLGLPRGISETSLIAPMLSPTDLCCYRTRENPQDVQAHVEDVPPISEISNTKLEAEFTSAVNTPKNPVSRPFPFSASEFRSNGFSVSCAQPQSLPGVFHEANETPVLTEMPNNSRSWLNDQTTAQL